MPTDSAPQATRRAPARAVEYLRAIGDGRRATGDGADPDEGLGRIGRGGRQLMGAATSMIGILDPERTSLARRAADGARAELLRIGEVRPVDETLAAGVVRTGRSLVLAGPDGAPEPYQDLLRKVGLGP